MWHAQVQEIIAASGGEEALRRWYSAIEQLLQQRPDAVVVQSIEGDVDATYQRLLASLI